MAFTADKVRQGVQKDTGYSIDNSLRFNDNDSAYLSWTPSSAGNRKTWTFSCWFKRGNVSASGGRIFSAGHPTPFGVIGFDNADNFVIRNHDNSIHLEESAKRRDASSWYHLVVMSDTTQSTSSDRLKLYVNGSQVTDFGASNYPSLNYEWGFSNNAIHHLGSQTRYGPVNYIDGYLAEVHFIDGQALDPTSFGETGTYGEWKPIEVTGMTYGTNGFYLDFSNSGSLGTDASSNTNNWTVNNLAATDQMVDTPTNNFCTLNPVAGNTLATFSEGNLKSTNSGWKGALGTFPITSGKWYWEMYVDGYPFERIGIIGADSDHGGTQLQNCTPELWYLYTGQKRTNSASTSYGSSFANGDIVAVAIDMDSATRTITFYKNNVSQGTLNLSSTAIGNTTDVLIAPVSSVGWSVSNFGQDSSFAGNKTAQGNQDGNEIGDFYYSVPTGFLALCTNNLTGISTPYQAYSSCSTEDEYKEVTYTGNGISDGTFIYLGFLATNICIDGTNYTNASTSSFDFLSNGIKCRSTTKNSNGTSYTLEAWVDTDFKYNTAEGN